MMERLVADRMELTAPYTGDGIEYLDRAQPYLPERDEFGFESLGSFLHDNLISAMQARDVLTKRYAWAIPDERALAALAALSPIVELGAGSGYWTYELRKRGAVVAPYDINPYPLFNGYISWSWVAVAKGGAEKAMRHHAERTLFICWPNGHEDFARAVELHRGDHVVLIGEGTAGGCTGSEALDEALSIYEEIETIRIPRWMGLHDYLMVFRRLDET